MGYFLSFYPPISPKNENFKKMKKPLEISSFYTSVPKIMIICYAVPEIWHVTHVIFIFHFRLFFVLLQGGKSPLTAQKIKTSKKWKKHLEISSFYTCVPKIMIRWCMVPEIWCATNEQTDGWKKWHKEIGAPPKNVFCQNPLSWTNFTTVKFKINKGNGTFKHH